MSQGLWVEFVEAPSRFAQPSGIFLGLSTALVSNGNTLCPNQTEQEHSFKIICKIHVTAIASQVSLSAQKLFPFWQNNFFKKGSVFL